MRFSRPMLTLSLVAVLLLTACAPAAQPAPVSTEPPVSATDAPAPVATTDGAQEPTFSPLAPPTDTPAPVVEPGDWQTIAFTNARTGETFTLADFAGKTVFVESMATWCSNCRSQMRNLREAIARLNSDDYVFIGLSVETNISAADLAAYVDRQEFDWTFAVLSPEALTTLSEVFGRSFTNPPATPHFVIKPDGTTDGLVVGRIHTIDELVAELTAANGG